MHHRGAATAEEALAIATHYALTADSVRSGVRHAVNQDGDSESTGAICGNLLGAALGAHAIDGDLPAQLEGGDVIIPSTCGAELVLTRQRPTGHLPAETARTSRNFTIFEGTSEIQRMIIGRAVTGLDVR